MILNSKFQSTTSPSGFSALLTVLVIGAAALTLAYSASFLGLGELDLGYTSARGGEALAMSDGCLEETLRRIRLDPSYGLGAGDIILPVDNGSCKINVADTGGNQRNIIVKSASGEYNKKIEANIIVNAVFTGGEQTGNEIIFNNWRERTD